MIHPGYGFLSENAAVRPGLRRRGHHLRRAARRVAGQDGRQDRRAGAGAKSRRADVARHRRAHRRSRRGAQWPRDRLPAHHQGGVRRRRTRDARGARSRDPAESARRGSSEAGSAFGNPAVFLERYIPHAKHIEVQILGDRHGNVVHLHERDCSVQRRHQKVIEIAPSVDLAEATARLCEAAVKLAKESATTTPARSSFCRCDTNEWFFIEMNPRIQVEHTVTEVITGIDLVRSQILIAARQADARGGNRHPAAGGNPAQRLTPCNAASPPRTRRTISLPTTAASSPTAPRPASASGSTRPWAHAGAVITPFYDSLLVKVTAFAPTFENALQRMDRALREFRIRGVKTNIPFLENVINDETSAPARPRPR